MWTARRPVYLRLLYAHRLGTKTRRDHRRDGNQASGGPIDLRRGREREGSALLRRGQLYMCGVRGGKGSLAWSAAEKVTTPEMHVATFGRSAVAFACSCRSPKLLPPGKGNVSVNDFRDLKTAEQSDSHGSFLTFFATEEP